MGNGSTPVSSLPGCPSRGQYTAEELKVYNPRVVFVDGENRQVSLGDDPADVPVGSGLLNPRFPA